MPHQAEDIQAAIQHLRKNDPALRSVIDQVGAFDLKLERNRFRMLVRSIVSQQISTTAARAIRGRLEGLLAPQRMTAETLATYSIDELRSVGLSAQKARYMLDLAAKVRDKDVRLRHVGRMSDEQVIEELTQVKGIGRWTAQMFLIFCLGRLDVFPYDDLGIRSAIKNLYGLDILPNKALAEEIAEPWRPYASVASWYCWRSGDLAKETTEA